MPDTRQPRPRRRRKKRSPLYGPISFLVICVAMIFGMSVFFRVSNIEVTGINRYSAEEIVVASEIEEGDNLFFINRSTATSKIFARLPYVENVTISRKLPNRLVIEVKESRAVAYLADDSGGLWAIDRGSKLLSQSDVAGVAGMIRVDGITLVEPIAGTVMADQESSVRVNYLSEILNEIQAREMIADVTRIDMSNVGSPSFDYLGRFTIKLGQGENVEYKFELMLSAVSQLAPGDMGTIDLSVDKRANFTPD